MGLLPSLPAAIIFRLCRPFQWLEVMWAHLNPIPPAFYVCFCCLYICALSMHKGCSKSKVMLYVLTVLCKQGLMRLNRYEVRQLCRVGCSFPWVPSWATVGWVSPSNRRLNPFVLPLHLFPLLLCWNPVLVSIRRAHGHMYCLMTTAMNHLSFKNVTLERRLW